MSKFILAVMLLVSGIAYAQTTDSTTSSSASLSTSQTSTTTQTQAGSSSPSQGAPRRLFSSNMFFGQPATSVHDNPVASFTASYVYTFTDSQAGSNRSLMGWSAMPEVRLSKYIDLQGDFTGLYVRSIYPGENRLIMAAGPRYTFAPRARFTPFVYGEGGEVRLTSQLSHNSDWDPVVKGGIGLEHKFTRGVAFTLIPGEYMGQQLDNHEWEHSFAARAGITFNLYR